MGIDIELKPLQLRLTAPDEGARVVELGRRMLDSFPENPDRRIALAFFNIGSKSKRNQGFVVLYDYFSWPTGTLKNRGLLHKVSFLREADEIERRVVLQSPRLHSLKYNNWEDLAADEQRVGTSKETIIAMRRALCPTHEDITHRLREEGWIL